MLQGGHCMILFKSIFRRALQMKQPPQQKRIRTNLENPKLEGSAELCAFVESNRFAHSIMSQCDSSSSSCEIFVFADSVCALLSCLKHSLLSPPFLSLPLRPARC